MYEYVKNIHEILVYAKSIHKRHYIYGDGERRDRERENNNYPCTHHSASIN